MKRHINTIFDRMPAETRELIGRLRMEGHTIHEIRAHLAERGVYVSVSTLGRYTRKLDAAGAEMRRTRAAAERLLEGVGEGHASAVMRLNVEMLLNSVMDILTRAITEEAPLSIREMTVLAQAIAKLAQASKTNLEMELAARREFAEKAAKQVTKVARSAGMTPELRDRLRAAILGLAPAQVEGSA